LFPQNDAGRFDREIGSLEVVGQVPEEGAMDFSQNGRAKILYYSKREARKVVFTKRGGEGDPSYKRKSNEKKRGTERTCCAKKRCCLARKGVPHTTDSQRGRNRLEGGEKKLGRSREGRPIEGRVRLEGPHIFKLSLIQGGGGNEILPEGYLVEIFSQLEDRSRLRKTSFSKSACADAVKGSCPAVERKERIRREK